jgi:hypothetical protein
MSYADAQEATRLLLARGMQCRVRCCPPPRPDWEVLLYLKDGRVLKLRNIADVERLKGLDLG